VQQDDSEDIEFPTHFVSTPRPPLLLWDEDVSDFVELVTCRMVVRVICIDPKSGFFQVRIKCNWSFRTMNGNEDTEIHFRGVPGIRMPGLNMVVEESRIWKDLKSDRELQSENEKKVTRKTIFWRGISTFQADGRKIFYMQNFPFDRQILDLERMEFVWRSQKDDADYYKSMKIVSFEVVTFSMLPEWEAFPAIIKPLNESEPRAPNAANNSSENDNPPTYATKFAVHLRMDHRHSFYVRQIFFVTYLITISSCAPLAMPPGDEHMGDRLSIYGGGMLTLVAFKYGIMDHLPSVPYSTFTDDFLISQICTITFCIFETLVAFRFSDVKNSEAIDAAENWMLVGIITFWTLYLAYVSCLKNGRRMSWKDVVKREALGTHQFENEWLRDPFQPFHALGTQLDSSELGSPEKTPKSTPSKL